MMKGGRCRVLLLGGGAREHALAEALTRSGNVDLFAIAHNKNPGIAELAAEFVSNRSEREVDWISRWASQREITFAVVGLEDPLDVGLPDALATNGIPTLGPERAAARVETSKLFLRELMMRHRLPGRVEYKHFDDPGQLSTFLKASSRQYALKPIGLTAGKGVKVMGVHLESVDEAIAYGTSVIKNGIGNPQDGSSGIIIEDRLFGPEFTLQAFVDGNSVAPMPLVRDFKRAFEGDRGPNTGSMGSYSQADGLLEYVSEDALSVAVDILRRIVVALRAESIVYKGVMYGQFCMTADGPKLIEINARFGDPEGINVLTLLETDFVDVCIAVANGTLNQTDVKFRSNATVCKYVTPAGYPDHPKVGTPIRMEQKEIHALGVRAYFAKVDPTHEHDTYVTTTSRSIALIGSGQTVSDAEASVEAALTHIHGDFHVRHDIGSGIRETVSVINWRGGAPDVTGSTTGARKVK